MRDIYSLSEKYSNIIRQFPGYFLLKTCESRYFAFSQQFAHLLDWKKQEDCFGRTDADLRCQASELAEVFVNEDQETLLQGQTKQLHLTRYCDDNVKIFITNKRKLVANDGSTIGILVYDEDVTYNPSVQKFLVDELIKQRPYVRKKSYPSAKMKITNSYKDLDLSLRECEVFFYLIRKESSKAIACLLNITRKTVEKHVQNIMEKLSCNSRQQLIEFAENKNLIHHIINSLFLGPLKLNEKSLKEYSLFHHLS